MSDFTLIHKIKGRSILSAKHYLCGQEIKTTGPFSNKGNFAFKWDSVTCDRCIMALVDLETLQVRKLNDLFKTKGVKIKLTLNKEIIQ